MQLSKKNKSQSVFKLLKSFIIKSVLNVAISFSMYKIKESVKKSFSTLLQSLVLTIFMVENVCFVVVVETRRVSTNISSL